MDIDKIGKILKRFCKRKSRNITLGAVIVFLLSSIVSYGEYKIIKITSEGPFIKLEGRDIPVTSLGDLFSNNTYIQNQSFNENIYGLKINFNGNGYFDFIKYVNFVQNGTISTFSNIGGNNLGNALIIENNKKSDIYINGNISSIFNEENENRKSEKSGNGLIIEMAEKILPHDPLPAANIVVNGNIFIKSKVNFDVSSKEFFDCSNGIFSSKADIKSINGNIKGNVERVVKNYSASGAQIIHNRVGNGVVINNIDNIYGNIDVNGNFRIVPVIMDTKTVNLSYNFSQNGIITMGKTENNYGSVAGRLMSKNKILNNPDFKISGNKNLMTRIRKSGNGMYVTRGIENNFGSVNGFVYVKSIFKQESDNRYYVDEISNSGNGVLSLSANDVKNSGLIYGYSNKSNLENETPYLKGNAILFSGNGISFSNGFDGGVPMPPNKLVYGIKYTGILDNKGIIAGSNGAVAAESITGTINNYGIMAGKLIYCNGTYGYKNLNGMSSDELQELKDLKEIGKFTGTENNYGMYLILKENQSGNTYSLDVEKIEYGNSGSAKDYHVINGEKETDITTKTINLTDGDYNKYIFNGVDKTLTVKDGIINNLKNSVVNGFKTAVNMNGGTLNLSETIINGGVDLSYEIYPSDNESDYNDMNTVENNFGEIKEIKYSPAVIFSGSNNMFTTSGRSVINGNIKIEGDSTNNSIFLGGDTIINGEIIGNGKDNHLYLGDNGSYDMKIHNNITDIKNISIGDSVTFTENIDVTGVEKITVKENGILNIELKKSEDKNVKTFAFKESDITEADHALAENEKLVVVGEGNGETTGAINFVTNGIGKKIYFDMENIDFDNLDIITSSVLDDIIVEENGENDKYHGIGDYIYIGANDDLEDILESNEETKDVDIDKVSDIYESIYNSSDENINSLRSILYSASFHENDLDKNEDIQTAVLIKYLNEIHTQTPYAFSSELSRKSAEMFRDIVTDNSFVPNYKKWLITGGLTHEDSGTNDKYYGKTSYDFDVIDAESRLTGAYVIGKYGYSDTMTFGAVAGGNKGETELSTNSKIKGNIGYAGGFVEKYSGNMTLKAGAGIQYSEYDGERKTIDNNYSDKYSDTAYDLYGSIKYSLPLENNFFLEPYGIFSYTHIDQDGASEENKPLAIETDDKKFDYVNLRTGVDLKKIIPAEKIKHILSFGVSYNRILDGSKEENITGKMKNSTSDFNILVARKNKDEISLNIKYEAEKENGFLFTVKGEYSFENSSSHNSSKNKKDGEWTAGAGIGYKF